MSTVLRKKQMNNLLGFIKEASFDPKRFRRRDFTTEKAFVNDRYCSHLHQLELGDTGITFIIAVDWLDGKRIFSSTSRGCTFDHDGPKPTPQGDWRRWTYSFGDIEKSFIAWLQSEGKKYFEYLEEEDEEQTIPDLWSELDVASADLSLLENTPFTEEERERIEKTLTSFLDDVERQELVSEDAFRLLRERVEYSIESSKRLSRKDWIMATTGALMGFVIQVSLTPTVANQLLQLAADALNWIWIARPLLTP